MNYLRSLGSLAVAIALLVLNALFLPVHAAPLMNITTSSTGVSCNGGSNGTANASVTGGTGTYTYSWAPSGGTGATASGLKAGTYWVTVTDGNLVQETESVAVSQPAFYLSASTVVTDVSGYAGSNGAATVTPGGGTPGYTYSWSPAGGTAATASGLTAGMYTVTVTDANGCSTTANAMITQPPVLTLSPAGGTLPVATQGMAYNQSFTANGGVSGYSYAVTGPLPAGLSLNSASGVLSGTPTASGNFNLLITVTDSNRIETTQSYSLLVQPAAATPPALAGGALPQATVGANYTQTITVTGGESPYTYTWSGLPAGLTIIGPGVLSGTPTVAGPSSFVITVTDKNGQTTSASYSLQVNPSVPTAAPNKTVSVAAGATATVDLTTGTAGGPFISALALPVFPSTAGVASIVSNGSTHSLQFVPAAGFTGVATVQYMLMVSGLPIPPGTVTITVSATAARTDAAQDAEVAGLATAQASAAQRFTTAQVTNFTQRLESLHGSGWGQSSFGLSLATDDTRKMARNSNGNGVADKVINGNPLSSGMRTVGLKAKRVAQAEPAASDLPDLPGATAEQARSPWAFWVNGTISYGRERTGDADDRYRFTTNGISAGVDYRVNSWITVGTGLGISTDRSRVGNKGTRSNADSTVAVAYASMRPMQGVFVDALLGYGVLSFDSQRYITATGGMATGSRDGKQLFGSIATGLEFYRTDWMWSPYARLEFSQAKLDAYTEDGPATHALKYFDQTARSHKAVLGARAEGKVAVRWGHIMPQVRVEYARSFDEQNEAGLAYADLAAQGPAYTLRGRAMDTGRWTVGLGGRLLLRSGVELGVEYTTNIDQSNAYVGSLRLGLRVPF